MYEALDASLQWHTGREIKSNAQKKWSKTSHGESYLVILGDSLEKEKLLYQVYACKGQWELKVLVDC